MKKYKGSEAKKHMANEMGNLSDSIDRTILGVLLALLGIFSLGAARQLLDGSVVVGIVGSVISVLCAIVIIYLIYEGITSNPI
ncbi:hypothetical protein [Halapricum desulfuricans]|uniref:hypothetical protein n=1 Tax=Halapricum desulfuricans TaxID=2841257 RepID=UPI001E4EDDF2|nr:hypothetical protein [Halapricum desulfuricans]